MQRWIVLVGSMGSGKSVVGRAVAERLRRPFLDADEEIERAAAMPVAEIFARDGEAFFRAREAEVIARLLAAGRPGVLATGGGAWMSQANRRTIDAAGVSVWLRAEIDTLWQRLRRQKARDARPLLAGDDPRGRLEALVAERSPVYALARVTVTSGPGETVDEVADRVVRAALPELAGS